ncbi:hypothetical protein [Glycomyces salinus]|uniref:hypothetical protein n=1 Tax=Glycomyces salinus TaxID=980294 RepID=UPI0018EB4228|nr:hypothetical protein [Glycomyces salinus]
MSTASRALEVKSTGRPRSGRLTRVLAAVVMATTVSLTPLLASPASAEPAPEGEVGISNYQDCRLYLNQFYRLNPALNHGCWEGAQGGIGSTITCWNILRNEGVTQSRAERACWWAAW